MTHIRRACPALSAPMETGDGLLVRFMPTGPIPLDAFIGLCWAARAHGNGVLEIIARGSVQVRGSNVSRAYWRNEAATKAAFDGGWFKTGDLARVSDDGYYALCGRESELIISGGFNIYPREIEDVLSELPAVREAVVVGAPDERRGEVPVAYIVAHDGFDSVAAEALCARTLASFKVPRAFIRVDALPRNALGKVQKHLLPPFTS